MAARYLGQFFSAYTSQQYTVVLYDDEYTGDIKDITFQDVDISYPQADGDRFDTIISAKMSARILINTADLVGFIEELAGAYEGRFLMQLLQGITPVFIGYVLPDLAQETDTTIEVGGTLDLQATDGLARLKTIDYNNNGTAYSGQDTFIGHILKCLNKLTTISSFYPPSNYILKTLVNWHAQQYTYSTSIDPLLQARTPHRAFFSIDSKGNYTYRSCFEVLQEICRAWGCRMFYANYAFWIVQVNEMSADAVKTAFIYTKTGTQSTETIDLRKTHDQNNPTDLIRISGGVYRFLPPLMKVQVDYRHIATRNLLEWWNAGTPETGVILDDYNGTARLSFSSTFVWSIDDLLSPLTDLPLYLSIQLKLRIGDQFLRRNGTISGGVPNYEIFNWTNDSDDRVTIFFPVFDEGVEQNDVISFWTPVYLSPGEFEFTTQIGGIFRYDGTPFTEIANVLIGLQNPYLELFFEGTLSGQSDVRRFIAVNNAQNNSAMIELTTIIGDGIGTNSPGHIEVQNDAAEWVLSDGWRVGNSGSYVPFSALLAQEIIRGQLTPVRRFQGRYNNYEKSIYSILNSVKRADGIMLPVGGTFSPAIDDINGEWFFNIPASSGWTLEPHIDIAPERGTSGGGNVGGGGGSSGGTTPPVRIYKQSFTGTTSNTVTVTANGGTLPTNEAGILIFLNQGVLTSDAYTVNGSNIELTFNLESSDTLTVIFFIQ